MKFSKDELSKEVKISRGGLLFFTAYVIALVFLLFNLPSSLAFISKVLTVVSPFLVGFAFAFLLDIPMRFFEKTVFGFLEKKKWRIWKRVKRFVSFVISIAIIYFVFTVLGSFIYKEVYKSITEFAGKLPEYAQQIQGMIANVSTALEDSGIGAVVASIDMVGEAEEIKNLVSRLSPDVLSGVTNAVVGVTQAVIGITGLVFNLIMSLVFAVYLLFGKERILMQIRKVMYAYLNKNTVDKCREIAKITSKTFTDFIVGQLTETVILGTMYYIVASLCGMPYPALIAVLMAIGGIIPVIGPFVMAIPSALLLLMAGGVDTALWFIVIAVIIQQVESNIIYPKIIGESIGLPGVWVLLAVLAGGSIGGLVGMIIAVPFVAVIYKLLGRDVDKRIIKRIRRKEITRSDYED